KIHKLPWDIPKGIDQVVHIHVHFPTTATYPAVKKSVFDMKVHGSDHGDEILNFPGIEGAITHTKGASLADSKEVDLVDPVSFPHHINAIVDIAVNVVVESQPAVTAAWIAPVDQVDIHTQFEKVAH